MCFQGGISSFQIKKNLYNPVIPIKKILKVYCLCRLPDTGNKMIFCKMCKEWFGSITHMCQYNPKLLMHHKPVVAALVEDFLSTE